MSVIYYKVKAFIRNYLVDLFADNYLVDLFAHAQFFLQRHYQIIKKFCSSLPNCLTACDFTPVNPERCFPSVKPLEASLVTQSHEGRGGEGMHN